MKVKSPKCDLKTEKIVGKNNWVAKIQTKQDIANLQLDDKKRSLKLIVRTWHIERRKRRSINLSGGWIMINYFLEKCFHFSVQNRTFATQVQCCRLQFSCSLWCRALARYAKSTIERHGSCNNLYFRGLAMRSSLVVILSSVHDFIWTVNLTGISPSALEVHITKRRAGCSFEYCVHFFCQLELLISDFAGEI